MNPLKFLRERRDFWPYIILFFVLGFIPAFTTSRYVMNLLVYFGIYLLMALGLNLMVGGVGLLALCAPLFFGVGAYTSAILTTYHDVPFLAAFLLSMVTAGIMAYVVGKLALRVSYHSFAIITLAFMIIVQLIVYDWVSLTKGPMGIPGIPRASISIPSLGTLTFNTPVRMYYLIFIMIIISVMVFYRIQNSRLGRTFIAIREDEPLAEAYGVNSSGYKIIAFVIGSVFGGMAGSFYAHYIKFISPEIFSMYLLTTILIIVIVGGTGYIEGSIIGALLFTTIPEALRMTPELRDLIYAILLIVILIKAPEGIYGRYRERKRRKRLQHTENEKGDGNEAVA
jgi:branched-chain amino acid transport system permease protein